MFLYKASLIMAAGCWIATKWTPKVGQTTLLSIVMLGEPITLIFIIASVIMAAGCWIAAK